jgi:putative flippase GtrA
MSSAHPLSSPAEDPAPNMRGPRALGSRGLRQFVKFGIVGASGFVVNLVIFTLLQKVVPNHAANPQYFFIYSAAFLSGGVSNYILNRMWTFRSDAHAGREGAKFMSVSLFALCVALVISALGQPYLGHGHKLWFVSTVGAIVVNFFINKYWTFRNAD